jgi:hypothetical protein
VDYPANGSLELPGRRCRQKKSRLKSRLLRLGGIFFRYGRRGQFSKQRAGSLSAELFGAPPHRGSRGPAPISGSLGAPRLDRGGGFPPTQGVWDPRRSGRVLPECGAAPKTPPKSLRKCPRKAGKPRVRPAAARYPVELSRTGTALSEMGTPGGGTGGRQNSAARRRSKTASKALLAAESGSVLDRDIGLVTRPVGRGLRGCDFIGCG